MKNRSSKRANCAIAFVWFGIGLALLVRLSFTSPASVLAGYAAPAASFAEPAAAEPPQAQITVSVNPATYGMTVSNQLPLTAIVQNDSTNSGVTWSVSGATCSGSTCGSVISTTANTAVYTAPAVAGVYVVTATSVANVTVSSSATIGVTDLSGVYTYRNDRSRSGTNSQEYLLTPANVNTTTFGKLFSCTTDGPMYTQPLWVPNVAIGGGTHNIVIVATEHDSVYAFDADSGSGSSCIQYWKASMLDTAHGASAGGAIPVPAADTGEVGDIPNEIGITSTPVIDPATRALYVVSKTSENGSYFQRLHALNLADGSERSGSPAVIATSVPGTGDGSNGSVLPFIPLHENQRPGLALVNGSVYTAWASHGDITPWHGWVIGQDASALAVTGAFAATPNSTGGGIWMAGAAPTVDSDGNMYMITSNGTWDGVTEFGDSFIKLKTTGGLALADWFTPYNQDTLSSGNKDLGAGGAITLLDTVAGPHPHLLIGGGKEGLLYLLNRDNMGHNHPSDNLQAIQTWSMGHGIFSSGLFWQNTFYMAAVSSPLQAFSFDTTNGIFNTNPTSRTTNTFPFPGPTPMISAAGTSNAILWAIDSSKSGTNGAATGPAILYAYDATNLATKLWDSTLASGNRDQAGNAVKFVVPTIANGKVYVSALGVLNVYGLLSSLPTPPLNLSAAAGGSGQIGLSWTPPTDNVAITSYSIERCQGSSCTNFAQVGTSATPAFTDSGLSAQTSYSYRVRAMDSSSRTSGYSNIASATTTAPDTQAPTAPANLTATAVSGNQINLTWTASTDNVGVTGYLLERCSGASCSTFAQIATPSTTSYSDTGLTASTSYSYRVRATDAAANLSGYSNVASATTSAISGNPNLVAAYSFNEGSGTTVADSSGNNNTGTLVNTTWSTAGKYGNALSFNGTNARVNIPDSASLHLTAGFTLEAWVNPSSAPSGWRDIVYKPNDNYFLEASTNTNLPGGGVSLTNGQEPLVSGGSRLSASTWVHLAMTYDGTTLKYYLNGALLNSTTQTGTIVTSTNALQIGGDTLYGQYFAGLIDEVRVYNIALTQAQIQTDMNTAVGPPTPDTTPPSAPTNLTATAVSGSQINLTWTASTDNVGVTGYLLERCSGASCSTFAQIATPTATNYSDTGLTAATSYSYRVRATDAAGNLSGYSTTASATTTAPDTQAPTAPANLTATAVSGNQINLTWTASTDNVGVTGYLLERCSGASCSTFAQIATPSTTSYSDTGLTASTSYSYRVRATDAAANLSGYSNVASATTSAISGNPNLVAAYSFNEGSGTTVADSSGNNNTGTLVNTTWSTAGKYGNALSFNGTNARVNIPDSASLHLTAGFTLEAWVNPSSAPSGWRDIVYKPNDNYFLEASTNTNLPGGGVSLTNGQEPLVSGGSRLSASTWVHLAMTYDGTTLKYYLNGALLNSTTQTGTIVTSTNALQIGGDTLYGQYFAGLIDEVRVYNIALTQAQIQTDMNTAVGPPTPDTTPPSAPTNLTATAVSGSQINLTWTASTDNVGVTGYLLERCSGASCSTFAQIATPTATNYSDTGLTAATSYSYRVRATDAAGNLSGYSTTASATTTAPDTQAPTAPANLTATAVSGNQINLTWTASTDNVGVTGYLLERCSGASCSTFAQIATPSTTSYSDTGLTASTSYSYRVRATDAAANLSGYSNVASATTSAISGNPNLVAAYSFNEGSGTTVADSSGNNNTGTLVNTTWSTAGKYGNALSFNGTNARVNIPDSTSLHLTAGFTLEAWVNPSSAPSGWRDIVYKPNDNYFLEASTNTNLPGGGVSLTNGQEPLVSGGSRLSASTWVHLAMTYDGTTLKYYLNGALLNSTTQTGTIVTSTNALQIGGDTLYGQYFAGLIDEVRVYNIALTQAQIQTDMNTAVGPPTPDTTPPSAPTNLTATAVSGSQINLTWTASTDNVGVTGYLLERCSGASCSTFAQIATPTATSYSDTGLTAATSYSYRVRATDAAGNLSGYSTTASATTTAPDTQAPTAPANLTATAVSGNQINLTWTASTDNVGVTGYLLERCSGASCSTFAQIATPSTTSYSDTGLTASTSYSYRVRATDAAANLSGYSNVASATTSAISGNPNLVAAYSFNEGSGTTVADSSGNNNTGTLVNTTWSTAGKYGNALSFNGTNARVNIPDSASLHLTAGFTLEAWVNPSSAPSGWRDIVYKPNDNYFLEASTNTNLPGGGVSLTNGQEPLVSGGSRLSASTWVHLAMTYDGTTLKYYLNGALLNSTTQTGTIVTSTNALQIGGDTLYGQYFAGLIDEVRVYNIALTQAQIQTDMNTALP